MMGFFLPRSLRAVGSSSPALHFLPPDEDALLNLQAAVDACFALVGYEQLLDYSGSPPPPPLNNTESTWLDQILHDAGLRI
jgi:hypothetical protein